MSHFNIRCRECGKVLENTYCAFCEHCAGALLVTEYKEAEFRAGSPEHGIWRFNWLPVHDPTNPVAGPAVYRSEGLARELGLGELYIAFSGYWPERGALVETCTFKEFEATTVIENARENDVEGLVVASAGNTARAFAYHSSRLGFPSIIVVPSMCLDEMWYLESSESVPTVVVGDGDYSDAIDMAKRIAIASGWPFEGGIKNIAKRDGLGVVLLEAVPVIGRLPGHYFQAVGSGAGAIAAWEMSERFSRDKRYNGGLPRLHLAQNLPFAPMVNSWRKGQRSIDDEDLRPELISRISTRVLSTRYPAYGVKGGVYDALKATGGAMYGVSNQEASAAMELFERTEGYDIVPAAAVAVGALRQAVDQKAFAPEETVLLNITGGGEKRIEADKRKREVRGVFISKGASDNEIEELICQILKNAC